jgi:ABC-type Co2+ transport system permease subunit
MLNSLELATPKELCKRVVKFLVLGCVVAVSALLIQRKLKAEEVIMLSLVSAATFALLDMYAPTIAPHAQQGAGLGIGLSMVGFPGK